MLTNREDLGNTSWRRGPLKTGIGDSNTTEGLLCASSCPQHFTLPVATAAETEDAAVPGWAATAVNTLQSSGILLTADAPVSRAQAAMALYRAAQLQSESIFDSR